MNNAHTRDNHEAYTIAESDGAQSFNDVIPAHQLW